MAKRDTEGMAQLVGVVPDEVKETVDFERKVTGQDIGAILTDRLRESYRQRPIRLPKHLKAAVAN